MVKYYKLPLRRKSIKTFSTIIAILTLGFIVSCATSNPSSTPRKKTAKAAVYKYPKSFNDSDFSFQWEYDLSDKKEIIVRGEAKKQENSEVGKPLSLSITGLDENGNRLKSGSIYLSLLAWSDLQKFTIKIPRTGGEKTFLFHYWYDDHMNASSGPLNLELWFEDSPDPEYVPEMLISPPGY